MRRSGAGLGTSPGVAQPRARAAPAGSRPAAWLACPAMTPIETAFGASRVLLPVVHPVSRHEALVSVRVAVDAGCKGVFLINQGLSDDEVLALVLEVRGRHPALWVGLNLLGLPPAGALVRALDACEGRIDGIWGDDAGINEGAASQPKAEAFVAARRARGWGGLYFGGVAFKYQREVPAAQLGSAVRAAAPFMDVICTSGPGTGMAAQVDKVKAMREGATPGVALALASGVTDANVADYLPFVDAFLVGTGIEAKFGVLDPAKVAALQSAILAYRPA